jgi:hypothetical protein
MSKRILSGFRLQLWLPFILLSSFGHAGGPEHVALQVELVRAVDAGRVKAGDPVLAKVVVKWQDSQCTLREGAIVNGRVVAQTVHSKTEKISQLALLFDSAQCGGPDMKPLAMTVAAVLAMDPNRDKSQYENQPLSDAVGVGLGSSPGPNGINGSSGGMRSFSQAAATVYVSPPVYKGPTAIMPGQVIGIRGVTLNVGGGPEGSSVLSISGHNLRLEAGSQFVLSTNLNAATPVAATTPSVPASAGGPVTTSAPDGTAANGVLNSTPNSAPNVALESVPNDETEVCLPPECSVALAPSVADIKTTAAGVTLSVKDLGYTPIRSDRGMYSFDYGSAISYLGATELLFTFNPHILISRTGTESEFPMLHIMRAVLINIQEKKVIKTVEWKVPDARQYLWSIGGDRVLVHVGRELRLYGAGLKLEQRLALNGPLAFLRTSPSSRYFAVGVIRERHSEATHRQLVEAEERDPEEDLEVRILDGDLHILATVVRSSRAAPPVLSENGEIQVTSISKNRWRIGEEAWDTQKRVLADVNSSCPPETTTLPPDLLFVVGCDRQTTGKWYRVLRPDGKPVLKGLSTSAELEQMANGIATGGEFTIGMAEAAKSIAATSAFSAADLQSERIAVYRTENGERLFAVAVPSPAPTVQTFVLSPDGHQLAVLEGEQIAFYEMPSSNKHR